MYRNHRLEFSPCQKDFSPQGILEKYLNSGNFRNLTINYSYEFQIQHLINSDTEITVLRNRIQLASDDCMKFIISEVQYRLV